jgi:hypothetical protein
MNAARQSKEWNSETNAFLMSKRRKWKTMVYFDLRTIAAWQFQQVNSYLKMAKYGRNMSSSLILSSTPF